VLFACAPVTPVPAPSPLPSSATPSPVPSPTFMPTPEGATIRGAVVNAEGMPVAGALVRVRATENKTLTAGDGSFTLYALNADEQVFVTAWYSGYYVGWAETTAGADPVTITLKPYYITDNLDYTWFSHEGALGSLSCSHCMPSYNEWIHDAHSQSAVNPRFLTMYNGTDVFSNQSPPTRYGFSRDYGRFPLRPDLTQPYYGPGYKLDFPDTAGNCAACHVPAQAAHTGMAYAADPNLASGVEAEGVFCEFCHKIGDVTLNPSSGLPYPNMPGVLSLRLYRPGPEQQLFFGNFDDVTRRVSYNPLYEQSQYCAPCHFGAFWDTTIYNSFGEWLDSPYSDDERAKTAGLSSSKSCQNCHMPPVDYDYFAFPEKGGLIRDSSRIFSHRMPGALDETLLQNSVTMRVDARREGEQVIVDVTILNDKTGHHVPTDSPLRHLILLVNATDEQGQALPLQNGPTVPEWGGVPKDEIGRMKDDGYYAGLPGKGFAKILMELWTEIVPSGAYWNPTRVVSDNRIPAFGSDASTFVFAAPADGPARIEVRLLFRRAFIELMDQKGWDVPDILMESETLEAAAP
ncbi:MAG: carboxypeptidase regulatory-like domain-containing protein, partial [Anaerolineales bacterium]|nr:carboxypeptidase regulatory-like domain-containing protein [Anaerolineales bacterium]